METLKVPVHVEAVVKSTCFVDKSDLIKLIDKYLSCSCPLFKDGILTISRDHLSEYLESLTVCDIGTGKMVSFWQAELQVHVYQLLESEPEKDFLEGEEDLPACEQWELPNKALSGLWNSIISDESVKKRLLGYCSTSMSFAEANVDSDLISWNRMVLLYGPPGTGKTTICKSLAQKIYIRNMLKFKSGVLLEINAHSLFSKWFSESGKLVSAVER